MLVVGHRRDETLGVGIGVIINTAVVVGSGPIPLASRIETRGEGIGITHRGVVDAAGLQIPCGESRGSSAEHESGGKNDLGLGQHCCISLSRLRPALLGDRREARRHPLNFRLGNCMQVA